jgi:hypothetical protein
LASQWTPALPYYSEPKSPTANGFGNLANMAVNPSPSQAMLDGCMAGKGWQTMY